jgi:hypothetical protein
MRSACPRFIGLRPLVLLATLLGGCSDPPPAAPATDGSSTGPEPTGGEPPPLTSSTTHASGSDEADGTSSSTGTTGEPHDCCSPHAGPSCDDPALATCVCEQEASCCAFGWDADCVALAEQCGGCGAGTGTSEGETTGPEPGACCFPLGLPGCPDDPGLEACVCAVDAFCCATQWDDQCVQTGVRSCGAACGPGDGCCSPAALPGCPGDPPLEACVCALDAFCCDVQWDGQCVQTAQSECGQGCSLGDCCAPHGVPGCDDPAVSGCVCALDGFCCDTEWDGICVSEAQYACGAACGLPPANMGDCCTAKRGPGCDDAVVTDCTCASAPDCCLFPWDDGCVALAVTACDLECEGVDPLDLCCFVQPGPTCGNAAVEACVCGLDPFCCDTQWDGICVDEAQADCMLDCAGTTP